MKRLEDYLYYEEENPSLKIYHGDCLEIMPLLPKVDLVVTDPPYGWGDGVLKGRNKNGNASEWNISPKPECFEEILKLSSNQIIFGGNYFDLPPTRCLMVWDKKQPIKTFSRIEVAWTNFEQNSVILEYPYFGSICDNDYRVHPTQKPVAIIKMVIQQGRFETNPLTILDPFLGSGTTLVACKELGRNGIGIEINDKYCAIAKKRLINTQRMMI